MTTQINGTTGVSLVQDSSISAAKLAAGAVPQVRSISASVGSNALTISAGTMSLDFRSTTLGSGSVTPVSGTPANLVISSGSTLGAVSAVQSRIVVLAINNAGTIELAAVNISGGNDLSETGLISTTAEGGAGGADGASVIYSTTARSSVAYRVIGYIESTQATAGTWATAPTLVQGYGGQALAAMSSLGYGQTWQNVAGSRALATTYYNTTGKPIIVSINLLGQSSAGVMGGAIAVDGISVSNSVEYCPNNSGYYVYLSAVVPPGKTYSCTASGSPLSTIGSWSELR